MFHEPLASWGPSDLAKNTDQWQSSGSGEDEPEKSEDHVYGEIVRAILEQRLAPGTRLTEERLIDIFRISRSVVRKTLARLSYEKIVVLRPNRGAIVAEPTLDEAHMVFDARILVERSIIESLSGPANPRQLRELAKLVEQENEFIQSQNQFAWIRLSGEFHVQLAQLSRNPLLVSFLKRAYCSNVTRHCSLQSCGC